MAFRSSGGAERSARVQPVVLLMAAVPLMLLAAACSSSESDDGEDGVGVQTVDAGEASGLRPRGTDDSEALDRSDSDAEQPAQDDDAPREDPGQASDDIDEPPLASEYPEITEEITPAPEGVKALLTPSGVLLGVTGVVSTGFAVLTPCGGLTTFNLGQPVGPTQVVIDPGHGGDEPGAEAVTGLTEAELNLDLAQATATELRDRGITVELTRSSDYRIPIRIRAQLADLLQPQAFVSIHHNTPASRPSPEPGTEVFVQTGSAQSQRLGGLLYEEVFATLREFDVEWTSRDDAGVLTVVNDEGTDAYGIARYPATPSALVEMAYLGNEREAELLATPEYLAAGASAIADGIERFLTTTEAGTGLVETPRLFNPSGLTGGSTGCVDPPFE